MQYEQLAGGTRLDLPRPSIDTGMGLERIAAVLQGTHDNYKIDLFGALIQAVADRTGVDADGPQKASHRVIADHLRATSFLIADGVLPSNEGRGYVLRRIMRRAMRHAEILGAKEPLMFRLVPVLVREMGQAYPELVRAEALITETLKLEETRFRRTLERGLAILDAESAGLERGDRLAGEVAFTLYDTYGFPLDLTQDALRARGIERRRRRLQRRDGAPTRQGAGVMGRVRRSRHRRRLVRAARQGRRQRIPRLRDRDGGGRGRGTAARRQGGRHARRGRNRRRRAQPDAVLRGIRRTGRRHRNHDGRWREVPGHRYAEEGRRSLRPFRRRRKGHARCPASRSCSMSITAGVRAIRANHSATHLLHEALRQVLGDHVAQKGSLVAPDRLRFDFSHPKPMSAEEIDRVEDIANDVVLQNAPVTTRLMALDDAVASGARALFGEKYGEEVRVVAMGETGAGSNALGWSVELCGGTHVRRTGDIGLVSLVAESAVAAGVRRIEALTGQAARKHANANIRIAKAGAAELKVQLEDMPDRIAALIDDRKRLERDLSEARRRLAMGGGSGGGARAGNDGVRQLGDVKLLARAVSGIEIKDLRSLADEGKRQVGSGIVAIVGVTGDGKAGIVVGVTADLVERFNAVELVRRGAEALGGKGGGGRADMAQAGGPEGAKAEAALEAIATAIGGEGGEGGGGGG